MEEAEAAAAVDVPSVHVSRIFVGGLSVSVTAADLEKTFSSLGMVCNVEFIRNNGRSFAYMDFKPNSDRDLAKLFAAYNGCTWKGGKLRLEKAKEHYLAQLKREWAEDAMLSNPANQNEEKSSDGPRKSESFNMDSLKLNIFFPKLKKVKSLPFKGTGKHKYSFQRVEVPSLPIHFCDCEEHCEPPEAANEKYQSALNSAAYEKELSIMNSVMSKLFAKENSEMDPSRKPEVDTEVNNIDNYENDVQVGGTEAASEEDEDNLVTNIGVGQTEDMLMQLIGRETPAVNQESRFCKSKASKEAVPPKKKQKSAPTSTSEVIKNQGAAPLKRGKNTENEFSSLPRNNSQAGSQDLDNYPEKPASKSESGLVNTADLPKCQSWIQKSSWRDLVGESVTSSFSISNLLPTVNLVQPKTPNASDLTSSKSTLSKKRKAVSSGEGSKSSEQRTKSLVASRNAPKEEGGEAKKNGHQEKRTIPKVDIGEVCPFIRSAESEKEWTKAKKALSGYIKKKSNENNGDRKNLKGVLPRR
ncbi:uncharacterized protein LOC109715726 [Ananas comosus]|uniref:Uncharacterized protein LOC109715726 n=1 Tax=Ananas comosus TaxID=4615 RepID=A0A6P5FLB1_ANACO|nr:uncharacterized protein LOC109715726 [Ananas comosus]